MSLRGIDVSNNNGAINWQTVAAGGMQFAIVKATEGTYFLDGYLATNWRGMADNNILRGCYHFAQPDGNAPEAEAQWLLNHLPPLAPGDIVALDIEAGTGDLSAWVLTWLQTVEQVLGCKPLLYSSPSFIAEHGLDTAAIAEYGLWIASWRVSQPTVPAPWPFWACWQYSAEGRVPGVAGWCDLDSFNGDAVTFAKYGLPVPAPPVDPCVALAARVEALQTQIANARTALTTAELGFQNLRSILA